MFEFLNMIYTNVLLFINVLLRKEDFFVDLDRYGFYEPANSQMAAIIEMYYSTVPSIVYILHIYRYLQWNEAIFTIDVIGHQWYWSYFLDSFQNFALLELYYIYHLNFDELEYFFTNLNTEYQFDFDQIMET